jgi:hypothetical protein
MGQALAYLKAMAGLGAAAPYAPPLSRLVGLDVVLACLAGLAAAGPWGQAALDGTARRLAAAWPLVDAARLAGLIAIMALVSMSLAGGAYNPFIYFRF